MRLKWNNDRGMCTTAYFDINATVYETADRKWSVQVYSQDNSDKHLSLIEYTSIERSERAAKREAKKVISIMAANGVGIHA